MESRGDIDISRKSPEGLSGSSGSFDDEDGDEPFDIFTGEATRFDSPEQSTLSDGEASVDTAPVSRWQWIPLTHANEIRLIEIDGDEQSTDVLQCRMRATSLDEPCSYHTLSYAWGETYADGSRLTHVIDCDGFAFRVTKNLHDALLGIRRLSSGDTSASYMERLPIWCDAICIDQSNPVERSRQVMMMENIYKTSSHLLVWLGANMVETVDILIHMARDKVSGEDRDVLVADIVQRSPWFERRWIIQEAASKPSRSSSILGSWGTLSMEIMRRWIECSSLLRSDDAAPLRERESAPLILNLHWFFNSKCLDDRDRVYALRSVSRDGSDLMVDYTMTSEEVYVAVARLCVNNGLIVPLLVTAVLHRQPWLDELRRKPRLPSWVPDWRVSCLKYDSPIEQISFRAAHDLLNEWALHPELFNTEQAISSMLLNDTCNAETSAKLQLTGWIFKPCNCVTPDFAEDCLRCLIRHFSATMEDPWLDAIQNRTTLVVHNSEIVFLLKSLDADLFELQTFTKLPQGQNLLGRISRHWITECGKIREMQDVVLV